MYVFAAIAMMVFAFNMDCSGYVPRVDIFKSEDARPSASHSAYRSYEAPLGWRISRTRRFPSSDETALRGKPFQKTPFNSL
jgi:hypothetical protein